MKSFFVVVMIWVLSFSAHAFEEHCNLENTSNDINQSSESNPFALKIWEQDYALHFLESQQQFMQYTAIDMLLYSEDSELQEKALNKLTEILPLLDSNLPVVLAAKNVCEYDSAKPICSSIDFPQLLIQIDPDNMLSYIDLLAHEKPVNKSQIIRIMSEKSIVNSYYGASMYDVFQAASLYSKEHPLPDLNLGERMNAAKLLMEDIMGNESNWLIDKINEILYFDSNISILTIYQTFYSDLYTFNEYHNILKTQYLSHQSNYNLPFPPSKYLLESCKQEESLKHCLVIAKKMINLGDTFLLKGLGYLLQEQIFSAQNDTKALTQSVIRKYQMQEGFFCYSKLLSDWQSDGLLVHPILTNSMMESYSKGSTEIEVYRQIAYDFYHEMDGRNITMDFDPYACESIIEMDSDSFLEAYGDKSPLREELAEIR